MFSSFSIGHADEKARADAKVSLFYTLLISFAPLLIGFFALMSEKGAWDAVQSVFLSGELYFYAMSLCASIYLTSQLTSHSSNLEMRMLSGAFVFACGCFMAFYIGQTVPVDASVPLIHSAGSVVFLLLSMLLYYRVMILAQQPPPSPEDVNRERVNSMKESVETDYD